MIKVSLFIKYSTTEEHLSFVIEKKNSFTKIILQDLSLNLYIFNDHICLIDILLCILR